MSVTTLNLPRLAYMSKNKDEFLQLVTEYTELAAKINAVKRYIVNKRIKSGNLPLYTLGFMSSKTQYSTCGINGVNEALEILGYDVLSPDGQKLVVNILDNINVKNDEMAKLFKAPHNCEQTPKMSGRVAA